MKHSRSANAQVSLIIHEVVANLAIGVRIWRISPRRFDEFRGFQCVMAGDFNHVSNCMADARVPSEAKKRLEGETWVVAKVWMDPEFYLVFPTSVSILL